MGRLLTVSVVKCVIVFFESSANAGGFSESEWWHLAALGRSCSYRSIGAARCGLPCCRPCRPCPGLCTTSTRQRVKPQCSSGSGGPHAVWRCVDPLAAAAAAVSVRDVIAVPRPRHQGSPPHSPPRRRPPARDAFLRRCDGSASRRGTRCPESVAPLFFRAGATSVTGASRDCGWSGCGVTATPRDAGCCRALVACRDARRCRCAGWATHPGCSPAPATRSLLSSPRCRTPQGGSLRCTLAPRLP